MDLHGEGLARVEQLDEDREAVARAVRARAEEPLAVRPAPQRVQLGPGERPGGEDALRLGPVDDLPGLPDRPPGGQRLAEAPRALARPRRAP